MQRSDGATLLAISVGEGRQWSRGWRLEFIWRDVSGKIVYEETRLLK